MKFEREAWCKLYRAESTHHLMMKLLCRSFRDHLLRYASEDGTLLQKTDNPGRDLAFAMRAHPEEIGIVEEFTRVLIEDEYLSHKRGRLWITRYQEGQRSRSKAAIRQQNYRERMAAEAAAQAGDKQPKSVTRDVTDNVTQDKPVTITKTSPMKVMRSEGEGEYARDATPASRLPGSLDEALALPVNTRAQICCDHPERTEWLEPHQWPELRQVFEAAATALGMTAIRIGTWHRDSGVKAILGLFIDGYSVDDLLLACSKIPADSWFSSGQPKDVSALTPTVVRRLLVTSAPRKATDEDAREAANFR